MAQPSFEPTHVITLASGDSFPVQLVDGVAYTLAEWESGAGADYERDDDGYWLCQGRPFVGTVRRIRGNDGTK